MNRLINILFYISLISMSYIMPYQITHNKIFSFIIMVIGIFAVIKEIKERKLN